MGIFITIQMSGIGFSRGYTAETAEIHAIRDKIGQKGAERGRKGQKAGVSPFLVRAVATRITCAVSGWVNIRSGERVFDSRALSYCLLCK